MRPALAPPVLDELAEDATVALAPPDPLELELEA